MTDTLLCKDNGIYQKYGLSGSRNLFVLISGILQSRTVNLNKIKDYVGGLLGNDGTTPAGHYQRLIRYFKEFPYQEGYTDDVLGLSHGLLGKPYRYIVLDGTKWGFGGQPVHLMTLCALVDNVAVPLAWEDLGKMGHSSQEERIGFFEKTNGKHALKRKVLLADREYVGQTWFSYLFDNQIDMVIRLKESCYKSLLCEKQRAAAISKAKKTGRPVGLPLTIQGKKLWWAVMANPQNDEKEPFLFFITSLKNINKAARAYKKRWLIECMFKHLKTNGFNLEDLGLWLPGKVRLMMAVLVLVYILAIKQGLIEGARIRLKKYADGKTHKSVSIFRNGLSWLMKQFKDLVQFIKLFMKIKKTKIPKFSSKNGAD